jgi:DNA-binding FadR family transcriptional regulator
MKTKPLFVSQFEMSRDSERSLLTLRNALLRAARELCLESSTAEQVQRFRAVVDRLEAVDPDRDGITESALIASSPYVIMTTGGSRSLIEMLMDDADDFDELRVAKLLLRSLHWKLPRRTAQDA